MKKVLVIGAGAQGGPCASILAGEESVNEIRLGDIDLALDQKVADKINSIKVELFKLDASDKEQVIKAADGVDVVINLTHLKFNDTIMSAALAAETHYVDTASTMPFWRIVSPGMSPSCTVSSWRSAKPPWPAVASLPGSPMCSPAMPATRLNASKRSSSGSGVNRRQLQVRWSAHGSRIIQNPYH